jgi:transmembrane sensor
MLALDGTRLDEAVHAINRYNTVKVRLSGEALGGLKMAGAFRATDPQGFAEAAGKTLNLRIAKRSAAEIVLSAK